MPADSAVVVERQKAPVSSNGGRNSGWWKFPSYSDLTISKSKTVSNSTYQDVTIAAIEVPANYRHGQRWHGRECEHLG